MNPTHDQLTAFALGEGTTAERDALGAYLVTHPDAAAEVAAISATAALLRSELSTEATAPGLDPVRRAALAALPKPLSKPAVSRWIRFPHAVVWPGLLAAGLAMVVMPSPETPAPVLRSSHLQESGVAKNRADVNQQFADKRLPTAEALKKHSIANDLEETTETAIAFSAAASEPSARPETAAAAPSRPAAVGIARAAELTDSDGATMSALTAHTEALASAAASPTNLGTIQADDAEKSAGRTSDVHIAAPGWHRVSTAADDVNRWSILGAEVDTASYAQVRRFLAQGQLPPRDTIRTEELLNSFQYSYQPPTGRMAPFAVLPEVGTAPWAPEHRLVRIALKGFELNPATRQLSNVGKDTWAIIAKDVTLHVTFNPAHVSAWRLLGYEQGHPELHNGIIDQKNPGGDIGAGHAMTALYEIVPIAQMSDAVRTLKNDTAPAESKSEATSNTPSELLTVILRWKLPDGAAGSAIAVPVIDGSIAPSSDFRFAAAVAEFAQSLREDTEPWSLDRALNTIEETAGEVPARRELIELIRKTQQLRR